MLHHYSYAMVSLELFSLLQNFALYSLPFPYASVDRLPCVDVFFWALQMLGPLIVVKARDTLGLFKTGVRESRILCLDLTGDFISIAPCTLCTHIKNVVILPSYQ
ncbi:unnamed protein product [Phytomonas sp. EM1]|nr:unnamed protein product [Phytomonas sp. EM1]|eukprot:CCW64217.1 unnamed protein product [Phytomonas sp. isolate EM1]